MYRRGSASKTASTAWTSCANQSLSCARKLIAISRIDRLRWFPFILPMRLIDLSHPLIHGQGAFPADPKLSIVSHSTIATARCNVSQVVMGTHHGTHLDAMNHFVDNGRTIDQMPLEWFYGSAQVLRIPKAARAELDVADFAPFAEHLVEGARIIYETGWWKQYGQPNYFVDFPSLTQAAAKYLADKRIRVLGMDTPTPSRDYYEVHHLLLGTPAEIVIIESLARLSEVPDDFTLMAFPLNFAGRDGSPIRAVARVD